MAEQSYGDWIRSNPPLPTKRYKKEHMKKVTEQQTAVEWFEERLRMMGFQNDVLIEEAKKIEKEQHGQTWDAAIKAHDDRGHVHARSLVDFDEYYQDTFKK